MFRALLVVVLGVPACDRLYSTTGAHHDAATPEPDGGATGRCSATSMLAGDFSTGTTFLTRWWTGNTTGTAAFLATAPDSVDVEFAADASATGVATITATTFLDLTEDSLAIDIFDQGTFPDVGILTLTLADPPARNALQFQRTAGMVSLTAEIDNQWQMVGPAIAYDPADRFWRFANHAGVTTWDTATNGTDWRTRAMLSGLGWLRYVRPTLTIERGSSQSQFTVTVSHVNMGATPGPACPIAQLADDFGGADIASRWQIRAMPSGPAAVQVQNGMLLEQVPGTIAMASSELVSSTIFDMRGGMIAVQRINRVTALATHTRFSVIALDGDDRVDFSQDANGYTVTAHGNATPLNTGTQPGPPWWRFRDDAGRIVFETSSTGTTWDVFAETSDVVKGLDRGVVVLGLYQAAGAGTFDVIRYDDVGP